MLRLAPVARAVCAGTLAGLVVGLVDGLRSAYPFGQGLGAAVATASLAMGVDGLLGGLGGFVVGGWGAVRAWGLTRPVGGWRCVVGLLAAGAAAGGLGVLAVAATAARVNRFLAAGVVVLVVIAGWCVSAALAPALARLFRRGSTPQVGNVPPTTVVGRWWSAPGVALVCGVAAFVIVWRTRAPLRGPALWERSAWVAAVGILGPWLVAQAARWPRRAPLAPGFVRGAALALLAVGGLALLTLRWQQDLQYLPWADVLVIVAMATWGVAMVRVSWLRSQWPRPRWGAFLLWVACLPLILVAASSEVARKQLAARAGLVGPSLAVSMRLFDADKDGYARLLGGGDCNDADPDINPAALDWPEDGIDQDCDGKDASWQTLAAPAFHNVPSSVPERLNIVLVAIDTLRADRVGSYGYQRNTTPHIDALAKQAVVFENGWAHAPSTRYSMPAMVTGRWPSAITWEGGGYCHDCRSWWPRFSPQNRTIGEVLKARGYLTGALWAYSYFDADERRGFERGMDVYDTQRAALHTNIAGPAESRGSSAREITDDALAFLSERGDKPFFLTVHYYDPHLSYEPHPEAPDFGSQPSDLYDAEVWFTDHHLGRLLDKLKAQGLWENTAIVITGDHGEGFGERGVVAHGYHLYPAQTKVPFVVRVPGIEPNRQSAPVSHVDLAPTLANLARAPHQPSFLGRSFVDLLANKPNPDVPLAPVFQEVSYEGDNKKRGIVTQTHQLIWNWTPHNTTECYEHGRAADLWDTPAGAEVCPALKAQLRKWLAVLSLPADVQQKMSASVFSGDRAPPAPQKPVDAKIGSALRVVGVDLPQGDVTRGQPVELGVHFQALDRMPEAWRLFYHLNGPGGVFVNLDHVPVAGAFPLERWRAGQTIVDRHQFSVAPNLPAGSYELSIGMWRGAERLPVTPPERADGNNRLRLGTFEVK